MTQPMRRWSRWLRTGLVAALALGWLPVFGLGVSFLLTGLHHEAAGTHGAHSLP